MKKIVLLVLVLITALGLSAQTSGIFNGKFWTASKSYVWWTGGRFNVVILPSDTISNKLGLAAIGNILYLGNGTKWTASGGSVSVPTLQSVTEAGPSTDQPVLFEFEARFLDSSGAVFYNKLKTKNLTQNNTLYLPNKTGTLATTDDVSQTLQETTDLGNTSTNEFLHTSGSNYAKLTNDAGTPYFEAYTTASGGKLGQLFPDRLVFSTPSVYKQIIPGTFSINRIFTLPDTTGTIPMAVKVNGTRYAPGSTGLIDLGTISGGGGSGDSSWITTETGTSYTTLGTIANVIPSGSLPTGWNDVTPTATVTNSAGKIAITGGVIDTGTVASGVLYQGAAYLNRIEVDSFYNYTNMRYRFTFVPQTKASTSRFAFTFLPNSQFFSNSTNFYFNLTNTDSAGVVVIRNMGSGTTYAATQPLAFSVGDSLEVQIIKQGWQVELIYHNKATGGVVRTSYTSPAGFGTGGKAYFGAIGGSQDITHFAVDVYDKPGTGIAFLGDSQFAGYGATSEDKTAPNLLFSSNKTRYTNFSNGGATLLQMVNSHVPNIIRLHPQYVIIAAGYNDRRDLATDTNTYRQRLDSVMQPILRAGITVILTTLVPTANMTHANELNFTTSITNLATTYSKRVIRIDSALYISSGNVLPRPNVLGSDAVHWSDSGQYLGYQKIKNQLPELEDYFKGDTTSFVKIYNLPTGNDNMEVLRVDAQNNVYKFPVYKFNGIPNSWNSNGAETYAQANTAFHISGVARTDSSIVSNSYTGGLIGFNKSTLSNFNITNAGTPGSNVNQVYDLFDNANSTRNFTVTLFTDKANARNTVRSTRNTLINNNQISLTGGSGNNFGVNSNRIVLSTGGYNLWAGTDALHSVTTGSYNIDFTSSIDYNGGTPSMGNTDGRIALGTFFDYTGSEVFANGEVGIAGRTRGVRVYNFGAKGGIATSVVWRPGFQAGTNVAGVPLYIEAMPGTGNAASGGIILATMTPGASGTTKSTTRNNEISIAIDAVTIDAVLKSNMAMEPKYTGTATSITLTTSHQTVNVTATGQTITLPTAVGNSRVYTIKLTASGTGTVATTSSQTIDGSTTYSLSAQYKYVTVQSDNANWIVIGNN